jgi:hypothetical protein
VDQFPTKTSAKREVEGLRLAVNADNAAVPVTVEQLVKHYEQRNFQTRHFLPNEPGKSAPKPTSFRNGAG